VDAAWPFVTGVEVIWDVVGEGFNTVVSSLETLGAEVALLEVPKVHVVEELVVSGFPSSFDGVKFVGQFWGGDHNVAQEDLGGSSSELET